MNVNYSTAKHIYRKYKETGQTKSQQMMKRELRKKGNTSEDAPLEKQYSADKLTFNDGILEEEKNDPSRRQSKRL